MNARSSLSALLLFISLAGVAAADGFIFVEPPSPRTSVIPLAVKNHHVTVEIEGQVAITSVDQVFYNPNNMQLEGTYMFPIPEGAGIEHLSLWIDGVEQKAELLDADKARGIYEGIVRRMKDPALLEYVGRRAFKLRVFPIPPRGERRVKLSYREVLPADGGLARYLYPLNTEKFSSEPLESVIVDVKLESPKPLGNVMVLSHKAEVMRQDDHHARIVYEAKNVTPDRDFLLHYGSTTQDLGLDVVAYRSGDEDGYALIGLSPRVEISANKIQPKDVVFVVDTSGSMHGKRFEQARGALRFCVDTLRDGDRFEIVTFSTEARSLFGKLETKSEEMTKRAHAHIEKLEPLGGTNIDEALQIAQSLNADPERAFMVVFLTDGLPTIGETTDVGQILKRATERGKSNQRIFAFGVGNDVNTDLLDRLSSDNRGTRTYVGESEDIEIAVSGLWQKIASPVLTDLELSTSGGVELAQVYPRALPDLFHGVQLLLTARYQGDGAAAIRLKGKIGGNTHEYVFECTFPKVDEKADYLPRLWAVRKVGYLLEEIRRHGESDELKDEVVRLSKKHGIMTPYTSFLVVEDEAQGRPMPSRGNWLGGGGGGRAFRDDSNGDSGLRRAFGGRFGADGDEAGAPSGAATPADLPAEEAELYDLYAEKSETARKGLRLDTGKLAVGASRLIDRLQQTEQVGDAASTFAGQANGVVRHVGERTFYRQGLGWVESAVYEVGEDAEIVRIVTYSDAYFELLAANPTLGKILALGDAVCFLENGKVHVVSGE